MQKIAHIINPVIVNESSDLFIAQPITFETMRIAKKFARGHVDVALYSAQYPEDRPIIPEWFQMTPDLNRSILDIGSFHKKRKLPLIKDILDRLYDTSDAEYLIYTNVDIAVMPHFYVAVNKIIENGYNAFVINRRTISNQYKGINKIPLMYAEIGETHPGWDCFVFKKDTYPKYKLGAICVGASRVGLVQICNLIAYARQFKEFTQAHLTFHVGHDRVWERPEFSEYSVHNECEALSILTELKKEMEGLSRNSPLGSFLREFQKNRDFGFAEGLLFERGAPCQNPSKRLSKILRRLIWRYRK